MLGLHVCVCCSQEIVCVLLSRGDDSRLAYLCMLLTQDHTTVYCAGPERSGSTWLFNAVRLLLKDARIPYDPYWITSLDQQKIQQRKL